MTVALDPGDALARLRAAVPANVRQVCATIAAAGFEAVTVGGAVRDALLGRAPGDWDVATSAHPERVLALFRHTVPTGLAHGTVTVVTGRGEESHVEVTTFRGEGAYTDARRPDSVTFGVPLVDDLARRDLVVNAMAYDPAADVLHDPFGGLADLAARRLRAVGPTGDSYTDAVARFTEDGLRAMRAVRFAAALEFELDAGSVRGLAAASVLASLARVSRERVSDELRKLLAARRPSLGLATAVDVGIIASVLPEVAAAIGADAEMRARWLARVDAAADAVRLAALVADIDGDAARVEKILKALKFSNDEASVASKLVGAARAVHAGAGDVEVRKALAVVGRAVAPRAALLWRACALGDVADRADAIVARRDPLAIGELAVTGADLIAELAMTPGPALGKTLAQLFARALEDPALNARATLLALARELRR